MSELKEGDVAPDFALMLDDGSTFSLSEQRGQPVVLYFYPENDTAGCTTENQEFSERFEAFQKLGATLVGVSPDTVESQIKFKRKHNLRVFLAADPKHLAIAPYGLWQPKKLYGREFMGLIRTSFIIDAAGQITCKIRATRIAGHAQRVLEAMQEHVGRQD